jgi:acid phosphatase (class A)
MKITSVVIAALMVSTPLIAQDPGSGYLGNLSLELTAVIPPPPEAGSPADIADKATYKASLAGVGSDQWKLATKDIVEGPGIALRMRCAVGRAITPQTYPRTMTLLAKSQHDLTLLLIQLKTHYDRPRPYAGDAVDAPLCETVAPERRMQGRSYPSGHAAAAMLDGYVLASLLPTRAAAILTRAREYGDERVVCRVHNPTDVKASQLLAGALFSRMQSDPKYQRDWQLARKELVEIKTPAAACSD